MDALIAVKNSLSAGISTFIQYSPNRLNSMQDILELAKYIRKIFGNGILFFDINRLLALDYKGRIKFCPAVPFVGPSILEVKWPDFWKNWIGFEQYRNFLWNNSYVDFENNSSCPFFYQCLGGCKYSKGSHYEVDRYAIDFFKTNNRRATHEKTCGVK